jgi:hypothetical protein
LHTELKSFLKAKEDANWGRNWKYLRPMTKLKNTLKLKGPFKILQGQNWITSWNQNSIKDLIE